MTIPVDVEPVVTSGQYALFAALRAGRPLPAEVAWALTGLLTQVAVTVHEADTGRFDDVSGAELRGWLDVLGEAHHTLTATWGDVTA